MVHCRCPERELWQEKTRKMISKRVMYLLAVMQALVVIFKGRDALLLA
jgi:hypothetical protein